METFSVGSCISFGWETFKKRPWFFIGAMFVYAAVSWVIGFASGFIGGVAGGGNEIAILIVANVISFLLSIFLAMGLLAFLLKAHDNPESAEFGDFWHPQQYWQYLGVTLLTMIVIIAGLFLLIVPGIIFSLMFMFSTYLVIDRKMSPIEAMKESARITKGHKADLFLLIIAIIGICIVGVICLLFGLVVALPIVMLAVVHAYRTLSKQASTVESAPDSTALNTSPAA